MRLVGLLDMAIEERIHALRLGHRLAGSGGERRAVNLREELPGAFRVWRVAEPGFDPISKSLRQPLDERPQHRGHDDEADRAQRPDLATLGHRLASAAAWATALNAATHFALCAASTGPPSVPTC